MKLLHMDFFNACEMLVYLPVVIITYLSNTAHRHSNLGVILKKEKKQIE